MAAGKSLQKSSRQGIGGLSNEQRQRLTLLAGAVIIMLAGVLLISSPKGTPALAQINACASLKTQQQYGCVLAVVNQTDNASYCSYLVGAYAQRCISAITAKTNSSFSCSALGRNSSLYPQCIESYAEKSMNASACSLLGSGAYGCVLNVSIAENFTNSSVCEYTGNSTMRAVCSAAYSFKNAVSSGNQGYCSSLSNQSDFNQTFAMEFAYKPKPSSLSSGYALSLNPRDYCYYAFAGATGNQSLCGSITQQDSGQCYALVANELVSTSINYTYDFNATSPSIACNGSGPLNTSTCLELYYSLKAIRTGNYAPCLNITSQPDRDSCIYSSATLTGNTSECRFISSNSLENLCYSNANLTSIISPPVNTTSSSTAAT